jgi:hypothetical protein
LIGQLLDKMSVGKRPSKNKQERAKVGYYVLDEDDVDRYVRSGSVAIERWGASEDWDRLRDELEGYIGALSEEGATGIRNCQPTHLECALGQFLFP